MGPAWSGSREGPFLTCRWLPSHGSSHGRERESKRESKKEKESSLVSFLIRTLILRDQSPTLMTSFNFNYFIRGPVYKYSHTGG